MAPIEILGRRNSANVQKVMWTVGELGLDYVRHDAGGSFGFAQDFPNPNRLVPAIRDGDVVLWESNACVRHLARRYGQGTLWPGEAAPLAVAEQWMDWQATALGPAFLGAFIRLVREVPTAASRAKIASGLARAGELYALLDRRLEGRHFVAGDHLTLGDIPAGAITYRYMTLDIERPRLPNVEAWYRRLTERPAYRKHVMIPFGRNPDEWQAEEQRNAGIQ